MDRMRLALGLLLLIVFGVVAAALVVPHVVDTADARRTVARWLETQLGREVAIDGPMRFTLLPVVGFVIEDLSVAGPDGLAQGKVLRLKSASVTVSLRPLLKRQVVVERIRIQSPQVDLIRNTNGSTNWDGLTGNGRGEDLAVGVNSAAVLLQFHQVTIQDGSLRIMDAVNGSELVFSRIGFTRRGRGDQAFVIDARVECPRSPVSGLDRLAAEFHLAGSATVIPDRHHYALDRAALNLSLYRNAPGDPSRLAALDATVSADVAKSLVILEEMRIKVTGASIQGSATGRLENGSPLLAARVALRIESIDNILKTLNLYPPPDTVSHYPRTADLKLELSANPQKLTLSAIRGRIDQVPLEGNVVIAAGTPMACKADLRIGDIDLGVYLPAGRDGHDGAMLPLPAWLSLDLALEAEALVWNLMRIDQVHLQMHCTPAEGVKIEAASGRYAGGQWDLSGQMSTENKDLALALTLAAKDVQAARLWPQRTTDSIRGRVDIAADITTRGADAKAIFHNAAGTIEIATRRPLQLAVYPETKVNGRLKIRYDSDGDLALDLAVQTPDPEMKMTLTTEGLWDSDALTLKDAGTWLKIETPMLPGPDSRLGLQGRLSLWLPQRQASLRGIRLASLGLTAGGSLDLGYPGDQPQIEASLDIHPFDLRPWLQNLGIDCPVPSDPGAPGRTRVKTSLTSDGKSVSIRDLTLTVDDTRVRGIVDILAFRPLRVRFMLDADRIDLDRYLPTDGREQDASGKPEERRPDAETFDIAGTITLAQLHVLDLDAGDVFARVALDQAALRLDPIRLSLYNGSAEGNLTLAIDGSDPLWRAQAAVRDAQLEEPLAIIFDLPVLSGRTDIQATLNGRKTESRKPVAGLGGRVALTVHDGMIHGVKIVPDIIAGQGNPSPPEQTNSDSDLFQPFDTIEGLWMITDGVAVTDDHRLSGPHLKMAAAGRVDFPNRRLDAILSTDITGIPVVYYTLGGHFGDIGVKMDRSRLAMDTTSGIVTSPLKVGQGTLGVGVAILDRGSQAIGNGSGAQQVGQGAMAMGKGVLEVGKGVLEFNRGGASLGQGVKNVGQGALNISRGVVGVGEDVLDAGVKALEGFAKGLERIFGRHAPDSEEDTATEAQTR